jgi:Ca2+-transporting ATPase
MFVIIELILAMNFRSLRYSILEAPPHKWLLIAIGWELALIAVLIQFDSVREAFGINMPTLGDVAFVIALGLGVFISIEAVKWALRRRHDASLAAAAEGQGYR